MNDYEIRQQRKELERVGKEEYLKESKNRLSKIQTKKLQTAFIGAISKIENGLGFLWGFKSEEGYSLDQEDIRDILEDEGFNEKYFKDIWQEIRADILTNGNDQVRSLNKELELYEINWLRYQTVFKVKGADDVQ